MPKHKPDADREVLKTLRRLSEPDTVLFIAAGGIATMRSYPDGPRVTRHVSRAEAQRLLDEELVKPAGVTDTSGRFVLNARGRSRLRKLLNDQTARRRRALA